MRDDIYSAACRLVGTLGEKKLTVSCAESCTGGLIGAAITAVPGSSEVFLGGVISYAVSVKQKVLGVSGDTVERFGVVSEQCAAEMARGVKNALKSDIAVSVTGIAGPGGGSETTPVGTVCFGVAAGKDTYAHTCHFNADAGRECVREAAVIEALRALQSAADKF